jgi:tRNA threonylcarbamoyl adenosine modification protein YeaZ
MRTLAIDSATEACSVALFEDGRLIAGDWRMLGRGHAEQHVPMIAALPDRGRCARIAVALGPGSFTGVRVGLAAARALALAWRAALVGYPTLDLVAAIARERKGPRPLAVAMTGGHGEWFVQGFAAGGDPTRALASLTPAAGVSATGEALVAGSQAEALVAARGHAEDQPLRTDARAFPLLPPAALTQAVQPLYGRAPDAKLPRNPR